MRAGDELMIGAASKAPRRSAAVSSRRLAKETAKALAEGVALLVVLPALAMYFASRPLLGDQAFAGWSQTLSLFPGTVGAYLRRAFYRRTVSRCEPGCHVSFGTTFSHPGVELGRNVYVGNYCSLGDVALGDDVLIASHVSIINGGRQHGIDRLGLPVREQPGAWPRVTIGRDSWIGERAVVMADIGAHCVIGAGAVVTRPIPDFAVAAGCPAKIIRYRGGPINQAAADGDAHARGPETTTRDGRARIKPGLPDPGPIAVDALNPEPAESPQRTGETSL